jgi:hypothetical protein
VLGLLDDVERDFDRAQQHDRATDFHAARMTRKPQHPEPIRPRLRNAPTAAESVCGKAADFGANPGSD